MRHFKFFPLFCLTILSCQGSKGYDRDVILRRCPSDEGIIISCVKCACVDSYLRDYFQSAEPGTLVLYGDTNCVRVSYAALYHFEQAALDSVYELNYNLIFFRKSKGEVVFRLVKTEESKDLAKIAERFFDRPGK